MARVSRSEPQELGWAVAELCRSAKRIEQLLGERQQGVGDEGQTVALDNSRRYLRNAAHLLDVAYQSLASVDWTR